MMVIFPSFLDSVKPYKKSEIQATVQSDAVPDEVALCRFRSVPVAGIRPERLAARVAPLDLDTYACQTPFGETTLA